MNLSPFETEGAGNAGRSMHPQPRMQNKISIRVSHHGHTGIIPAFPAQWFYGLLRALPGDQALLSPSPALLLADLAPASGRQNHTTSPSAAAHFVKRTARVHRIPPRVRDVRTPLCLGRDGQPILLIWVRRQAKFLKFRNRPGGPPIRHGRACPGHPRLMTPRKRRTRMHGTSPAMTN